MPTYSFYDATTGTFTGGGYSGPDRLLPANTPAGCAAWPAQVDWRRQRVDLATQALVSCQPPRPADTAWETWAWDDAAQDWTSHPTLAALMRTAEGYLQRELDAAAAAWGYDSLISAASYVASTHPQFAAEAQALVAWRDAVWVWAQQLRANVESGATQCPATESDLLAVIPPRPARPQAIA